MPWHDSRLVRNEVPAAIAHAKFAWKIWSEPVRMVLREIRARLAPRLQVFQSVEAAREVMSRDNEHCIATHARHTNAHVPKLIVCDLILTVEVLMRYQCLMYSCVGMVIH